MNDNVQAMQGKATPGWVLRHTLRAASDICLAWSPDGRLLATVSSDTVQLWDVARGSLHREISGDLLLWVLALCWSPDGRTLALGSRYGEIQLWDTEPLRRRKSLPLCDEGDEDVEDGIIDHLAWSPDGQQLLARSRTGSVTCLDVGTGTVRCRLFGQPALCGWSPDGLMLACTAGDAGIVVVDAAERRPLWELGSGPTRALSQIVWSPDGRLLCAGALDGSLKLWDVASRRLVRVIEGHREAITSLSFSAEGRCLATGSPDRTAVIWRCDTFRRMARVPLCRPGAGLCFHPTALLLAVPSVHYFQGVYCHTTDLWALE